MEHIVFGIGITALTGALATVAGAAEDTESNIGSQGDPNSQVQLAPQMGFLHRIFSARSLGLFGELAPEAIASYLSGQVIGTEVAHAIKANPHDAEYAVLASPGIGGRYVKAIEIAGLKVRYGDPNAIVKGLAIIARKAGII